MNYKFLNVEFCSAVLTRPGQYFIEFEYDGTSIPVSIPVTDYNNADEMAKAIQAALNAEMSTRLAINYNSFRVTNYDGRMIISNSDLKFEAVNLLRLSGNPPNNLYTLANAGDANNGQVRFKSVDDFWRSVLSELGVKRQEAIRMDDNQSIIVEDLDSRREAVSGVNMDEEATNMIRFQSAYNAAARYITTIDEMLDVLINRTGIVGR